MRTERLFRGFNDAVATTVGEFGGPELESEHAARTTPTDASDSVLVTPAIRIRLKLVGPERPESALKIVDRARPVLLKQA
jgi:hypothetical protein